jgi:hypothetical protein
MANLYSQPGVATGPAKATFAGREIEAWATRVTLSGTRVFVLPEIVLT